MKKKEFLIKLEVKQFWFEVCNTKSESGENLFPTLTLLVEAVFSIAHSNAEPERSFSDVNLVKDDMSTRTTTGFLNARCFLKSINKANNAHSLNFTPSEEHYSLFNAKIYDKE